MRLTDPFPGPRQGLEPTHRLDWDAMAKLITDDICVNDRRRVVSAGAYHGRDAEIASLQALANVGVTNMTATAMSTFFIRGAPE